MTRHVAFASVAALALVGSAVVSAQPGRPANNDQRPRLEQRGPGQGQGMGQGAMRGRGPGMGQGQGAMRGRGPGMGQGQGAMRGRGPGFRRGPGGPGLALRGLDLTEAQQAQVKALREKTRQEIEALLTPEQLAKLKERRGR